MGTSIYSATKFAAGPGIDASSNQGGGGGGGLFYQQQGQQGQDGMGQYLPPTMLPIDFSFYNYNLNGFGSTPFFPAAFGKRIHRLSAPIRFWAAELLYSNYPTN